MGNMSYCRFENTSHDLVDCFNNLDETGLSEYEESARRNLIATCIDIIEVAKEAGLIDADTNEYNGEYNKEDDNDNEDDDN
jgi:hypothetical protein